MNGGGFKISIPTTVRKIIEDIKEITGKHSEEEVYAMLKECSMDPNETVQKLLLQDPFHEVKRKRDRKKENANSRESVQLRWKNGLQGRALQGGRVHIPPRAVLHNAVGRCNAWSGKENEINHNVENCIRLSLSTSNGVKEIEEIPVMSKEPVINNVSTNMASESGIKKSSASSDIINLGRTTTSALLPAITNTNPTSACCTHHYVNNSVSTTSPSSSAECFLSADPVLDSSIDRLLHSTEAPSKHEMQSQQPVDESIYVNPMEKEFVGSNQDRKPKPGISVNFQGSETDSDGKIACQSPPAISVRNPDEVTSKLEKKLAQSQLVILPKVIQIPESERPKLSFGSFDFGFGVTNSYQSEADVLNSSTIMPETSQSVAETSREKASSGQVAQVTGGEGDNVDVSQINGSIPETLASGEGDVSFGPINKSKHVKEEAILLPGAYQTSFVPTSPIYSLGFVAPPVGVQFVSSENSDSQEPDVSCFPNYTVQQTFDPTNYYSQQYCITTDISGHYSTFPSSVVATKYNGNGTDSHPSLESTHEGAAVVTQAAGIVQSSIPVDQRSIPAFGPPIGMPLSSHYPPSYFPYGHYFLPFYVSPTAIHQFLGNNTFMQCENGSVYPSPPLPAASVKSTTKEDLGASQLKETNVCITGPQFDGSVLRVAAHGNEISRFLPGSLCNFPLPGKHVMFTSTQTGHSPFTGFYHPAQAVATSAVHPILQRSQAVAGAADLVGTGSNMYQLHQHPQINWPINH